MKKSFLCIYSNTFLCQFNDDNMEFLLKLIIKKLYQGNVQNQDIFARFQFHQEDKSLSRNAEGSGIGLLLL